MKIPKRIAGRMRETPFLDHFPQSQPNKS